MKPDAIDKLTKKQLWGLTDFFEQTQKHVGQWTFNYEYPGHCQYENKITGKAIDFFIPAWAHEGECDIQFLDETRDCVDSLTVKYNPPVTAEKLFACISPHLKNKGG